MQAIDNKNNIYPNYPDITTELQYSPLLYPFRTLKKNTKKSLHLHVTDKLKNYSSYIKNSLTIR